MRKPLTLLLIAAAGALLAACGGVYSDGSSAVAPAQTATAARHAGRAPAAAAVVTLKGTAFQPGDVHVRPGETIRFVNADPVAHTVTATKGAKFDSGTLDSGGSFTFRAAHRGTISYVCLIHPGMEGTITVR